LRSCLEVLILVVLGLMFKILNSFAVQLSQESGSYELFADEANQTVALASFMLLLIVVIFIFNWYVMLPSNFTEDEPYLALRFRNMKPFYPLVYLSYQLLFICLLSIFYQRDYLIYILLACQLLYFALLLYLWPYNTPRKTNRILHNCTVLFNQFLLILTTVCAFRWRSVLPGDLQLQSNLEFTVYLFLIVGLLLCSTVLALLRLCIFNKDVQCLQKAEEEDKEELNVLREEDASKFNRESLLLVKKKNSLHEATPNLRE
jgi:hypothetical protein